MNFLDESGLSQAWSLARGYINNTLKRYLPLTGGTMTGAIILDEQEILAVQKTTTNNIRILGGTLTEDGAGLFLFGGDTPTWQGTFLLRASRKGVKYIDLRGDTTGNLAWNGKKVDTVEAAVMTNSGTANNTQNYIRYRGGLQISWGRVTLNGAISSTNKKVTFSVPFATIPAILSGFNASAGGAHSVVVGWESTTSFNIGTYNTNTTGATNWIAVGRWQ